MKADRERWVAGVDGCRAGWFAVFINEKSGQEEHHVCPAFRDVLGLKPGIINIAVDIPIGLLDEHEPGGRECDKEARRKLGRPRMSSVFSPPIRAALRAASYPEAVKLNGPMTLQTYHIMLKIKEVEDLITPESQSVIKECHPELSLYALAGRPMLYPKKKRPGREERLAVLDKTGFSGIFEALSRFPGKKVGADDVIDAYAAAWSALRMARKENVRLPNRSTPGHSLLDSRGLRMEICF